jgi:outer membrane protein TolC
VNTLADHLKNVKAQFDVGVVAKVDVLRSEVELSNARQTLIKAQQRL